MTDVEDREAEDDVKIVHYSASQLTTFERCNLKWWWEKIGKFRTPPTASQALGTEIHAQHENWIDNGVTPVSPRASEALRHYKENGVDRGPDLLSERSLRRPIHIPDRVMVGFIDITHLIPKEEKVWDIKSTSDINRYAKTDYQLQDDLQLNLYAFDTFETLLPKTQELEVAHLYIQTRGAIKSRLVKTDLDRGSVTKRYSSYLRIVDNIEQVRQETDPGRVPHNETACNDYGGCPHRIRCNALVFGTATTYKAPEESAAGRVTAKDLMGSTVTTDASATTLMEEEMLNPPDSTRRPEGAPPATPDTVATEDLPPVLRKARERDAKIENKTTAMQPNPTGGTKVMNPLSGLAGLAALGARKTTTVETKPLGAGASLAAKLAGAAGAAPPPAQKAAEPPKVEPAPQPAQKPAGAHTEAPKAPATRAAIDSLTAQGPPAEKRGPGRPKGAKNKSKEAEATAPSAAQAVADAINNDPANTDTVASVTDAETVRLEPARVATSVEEVEEVYGTTGDVEKAAEVLEPPPAAPAPSGGVGRLLFLFLDAVPVYGFPQGQIALAKWLEPALEAIKTKTGAPWDFHEFRKGPAVLNKFAAELVLPQAMVVNTHSPEAAVLLQYLINKAEVIIQGTR